MVHKVKQRNINFNLDYINVWCINCNQCIQNEIKNNLCMKAKNHPCFKLEEKITRSVKKNKKNYTLYPTKPPPEVGKNVRPPRPNKILPHVLGREDSMNT